nr:hypothetical protein [uncultured Pseudodesulfovibrio sp.]
MPHSMSAKPEQGESKQDFLKRCMDGDKDQLPSCVAAWNKANLTDFVDDNKVTLTSEVGSVDIGQNGNENGDFVILAYTGKVIDWGWLGRFVIDLEGLFMAKPKIPALLEHWREGRVGFIDSCTIDENGFHESGSFLSNERAQSIRSDAADGFPWQASIGVQAHRIEELKEGEKAEVNGMTVEGPIDIWRKASVFETSFCAFGADDDTAAVAMSATAITQQEESMNKRLKEFLERRGLKAEATDQEAWAFLENLDVKDDELTKAGLTKQDLEQPDPADGPKATMIASDSPASKAELSGMQVLQLTTMGEGLGLSNTEVVAALSDKTDEKDARLALYQAAEKKNPAFGAGRIEMGLDERDKIRMAATDGMAMRLGVRMDKPAAGYEEFRHMTLHGFARLCLEREGIQTKGMTKRQLAQKIIRLSASGVSTGDFAGVFMDASHKRLLKAYTETASTWRPWCNIVEASDFKTIHGIALSEAPDLDLVAENGEYKTGHLKEKQESYSIGKYGKILSLTLEMIVNDDLRAFAKLPRIMGAAAKRKESDIVYGLLTGNPMMADGKALFSSDHRNLSGASALSSDSVGKERAAMRKVKGMNGVNIDVTPRFLLVPTVLEDSSVVILRSQTLPEDNKPSGVVNPNAEKLIPISDPRLDDASETAYYTVGDPNQVDTIEVAFLDGVEEPTIEENDEFVRDAVSYKVRHIFGAGVVDYVGMRKNPGA